MNIDLTPIIQAANRENAAQPGDYIADGFLHCGKCRTPKQTSVEMQGETHVVGCMCDCAEKQYAEEKRQKADRERELAIRQLRVNGIQDEAALRYTFANDNGRNPKAMDKAKRYAAKWPQMYKDSIGLLFWGNTGNGKTYSAACIANELISKGIPVLMTGFAKLLSAVTGLFAEERTAYLDSLDKFHLLVIDDLGAERQSGFAMELVYTVIDNRYKSGQPMITTTNLTLDELKNPKNMDYQRIYDRVLEMCVPIHFEGESLRKAAAADKLKRAAAMFAE